MGTQPISLKNQLGKAKENGPNWWTEYHCQCKTVDMGLGHHAGIKYCGCAEIFNEATCKSTVSFGRATAGQTNSDGSIATTMAQNPKGDGYHATALGTAPDNCARHNSWCCNWAKCVGAHGFQETECQYTQNGCVPKPNANKCIWKKRERIVYKKVQGNKQFIYSEVGEYAEKEDVEDAKAYVRNKDLPIYTGFCPKGNQKKMADCQGDIIGATRVITNTHSVYAPVYGKYSKPATGKCEDTGGNTITSLTACQTAATNLGLAGTSKGTWSHVPPGCSMWGSKVHYNYKLASTRSCDYSHSKYCICKKMVSLARWQTCGGDNSLTVYASTSIDSRLDFLKQQTSLKHRTKLIKFSHDFMIEQENIKVKEMGRELKNQKKLELDAEEEAFNGYKLKLKRADIERDYYHCCRNQFPIRGEVKVVSALYEITQEAQHKCDLSLCTKPTHC